MLSIAPPPNLISIHEEMIQTTGALDLAVTVSHKEHHLPRVLRHVDNHHIVASNRMRMAGPIMSWSIVDVFF